jgi:DNA-binding transcriptional ArsR family regulator
VVQAAVSQRSLSDARDVAAAIDARIRQHAGSLVAVPPRPWSEQVPVLADPDRHRYVSEIAAMMDARKERIGEHAAEHPPPWALNALGPVPGDLLDRLDWQQRASDIGTYRELSGYQQVVWLLARHGRAMNVGEIVARVDVGQSTVSAHLKVLAEVGFVVAEQRGTACFYRVNKACVECFPTAADIVMGRPVPARPG